MGSLLVSLARSSGSAEGFSGLETALFLITSSGFTAIVVSVITAIVNKRKLKAESASLITGAASALVDRLEKENVRLNTSNDVKTNRISDLELIEYKRRQEAEVYEDQIKAHVEYDQMLIDKLYAVGIQVPPPPPLIAPRREYPKDQ